MDGTFLEEMLLQIFTSASMLDNIKSYLTASLTSGEIWTIVTSIYSIIIKPVGMSLIFLYFWLELIEKATSDRFNIETIVRLFIKMAVAYVLILYGLQLFQGVIEFGNAVASDILKIETTTAEYASLETEIHTYVEGLGFIGKLINIIFYLLPYLASCVVGVIIMIQCWSRNINLLARVMLAPIALADMFNDGPRAQGFMYIRKTLAVALQGAIMIIVAMAASALTLTILGTNDSGALTFSISVVDAIKMIGIQFIVVSLMQTAGTIANDVCGVH